MACLYSLTVPWMRTSCKNLEDRSVSPKYRQIALLGLGGRMNRKHPEQKENIVRHIGNLNAVLKYKTIRTR